jgi:hypothetical protein
MGRPADLCDGLTVGALRRHYGGGPTHLLALLSCFALSGYAATRVVGAPGAVRIGIWFGGAVIGHDLVLFPLYTVAGHLVQLRRGEHSPVYLMVVNHIRIPAGISALLLLVWFPLILGLSDQSYRLASGLNTDPYLGRWLFVTGVLFGGSALALGVRLGTRRRARPAARRQGDDARCGSGAGSEG